MTSDNEFLRGPKWRTQTSPQRRHRAAAVTFASTLVLGAALMVAAMWLLSTLGAPGWLVALPWWLPTLAVVVWTIVRPSVAVVSDDDDESWAGYANRYVLVGEDEPRPAPARIAAAVLFGAPVAWALLIFAVLTLTDLM
jgi:hypothetical protein